MKTPPIIIVVFVLLLVLQPKAWAKPCDMVAYLSWNDIYYLDADWLVDGWTKDNLLFPAYIGVVCIDNVAKTTEFIPLLRKSHPGIKAMSYVYKELSMGPGTAKAFALYWNPRDGGDPIEPGAYFSAMKSSPKYPEYVLRYLNHSNIVSVRVEYNAKPDLSWKPTFKYKTSYRQFEDYREEEQQAVVQNNKAQEELYQTLTTERWEEGIKEFEERVAKEAESRRKKYNVPFVLYWGEPYEK